MIDIERRDIVNQDTDTIVIIALIGSLGLFKGAEGGRIVCTCRLARYGVDRQLGHLAVSEYTLPTAKVAAFQPLWNVIKVNHGILLICSQILVVTLCY